MKERVFMAVLMIALGAISIAAQLSDKDDDKLYNEIQTLTGKVTIKGQNSSIIPVGQSLIFQRRGCKRCLYVATTDEVGKYEIRVARGKYRLIFRYGTRIGETTDGLPSEQSRTVDVNSASRYTNFDVTILPPPAR